MRKPTALLCTGLMAGAVLLAAPASAADVEVTATVSGLDLLGGRVLTVTPPTLAGTGSTLTGSLVTQVVETNATGINPWSVTAVLTEALANGENTIPAANLSAGASMIVPLTSLLTGQTATSETGALDVARKVLQVSGESPLATYTNTFTSTTPLSLVVPNGTVAGSYTGTMTVTLVQ